MGRFSMHVTALVAVVAIAGCRDAGSAALRSGRADVVTFEVGGDGPSLGELLRQKAGPPRGPDVLELPTPEDVSDGPARRFRSVKLAPGQTLSQLCAAELGSASRWRDVATLNGWTEDEVNHLPVNTPVKLPPR